MNPFFNLEENSQKSSFVELTDQEIDQLLIDSKSRNTNGSTNSLLNQLKAFLKLKNFPNLEQVKTEDLPKILTQFYSSVRTTKSGELYQTSSFKVLRAGINRYFKRERNIDIVSDELFVKAKKSGMGVTKSYPHIMKEDLRKISDYFNAEHTISPNPRVLQQCVQFFIMYFFCRRGQEIFKK